VERPWQVWRPPEAGLVGTTGRVDTLASCSGAKLVWLVVLFLLLSRPFSDNPSGACRSLGPSLLLETRGKKKEGISTRRLSQSHSGLFFIFSFFLPSYFLYFLFVFFAFSFSCFPVRARGDLLAKVKLLYCQ
jgi:hypothetical protein